MFLNEMRKQVMYLGLDGQDYLKLLSDHQD